MPETEIKTVNSMFAGRTTEIPWIAIQKKGRCSFALLPETILYVSRPFYRNAVDSY